MTQTATTTRSAPRTKLSDRLRRLFRRRPDPWDRRLDEMPDWLLHDIGLTRWGERLGPFGMPLRSGKPGDR
jgi:uncharacterized protein YjiS (DUF1127 family)